MTHANVPTPSPFLRLLLGLAAGTAVLLGLAVLAADSEPVQANGQPAPGRVAGEEQARYIALSKHEIELQAQLRTFTDLSQLHEARADAARGANKQDQAAWERDLSTELAQRASQTLSELNRVTKDRMALEDGKLVVVPFAAELNRTNTVNPDEEAYLAKLQERVLATEQELASLADMGKLFLAQLQTNSVPQEIERISLQLEDHGREVRIAQKELTDLELRRLEFRANRSTR